MERTPTLVVFDIDGTLAKEGPEAVDIYDDNRLAGLQAWPNMVAAAKRYISMQNVEMMFCSGRPQRSFRATWAWLNRHLGLTSSGKRITVSLRPDDVPEDRTATCKLGEIVQAIRRLGSKPSEALIFDDDVMNLQMFETIRPMVRRLRLYKVEHDVASQWNL